MEARKRAATKRRKLKSIGKSKSTETDEDDEDAADEGEKDYFLSQNQSVPQDFKFWEQFLITVLIYSKNNKGMGLHFLLDK